MPYELDYDLSLKEVEEFIKREKIKKVLIQIPDGLKYLINTLSDFLEQKVEEVYISSSHCWGACDLAINEAKSIGADCVIHVGHIGPYHKERIDNIRIFYIPAYYLKITITNFLDNIEKAISKDEKIGLVSSIQHIRDLLTLGKKLAEKGYIIYIGKPSFNWMYPGQVMGCEITAALSVKSFVNTYVCISGGIFHSLPIRVMTNKRVIVYDPYLKRIEEKRIDVEIRKILAKKLHNLIIASEGKHVGILVCKKIGQLKVYDALRIKKELEGRKFKPKIILIDEIRPEYLENLPQFDFFVNTGCPRVGIDDIFLFERSIIINLGEVKYLLDKRIKEYSLADAFSWRLNYP